MTTLPRRVLSFALILSAFLCSTACKGAEPEAELPPAPAASAAATESTPAQAVAGQATAEKPADRLVIKEAQLSLRSTSPEALLGQATTVAARHGGFVVNSEATHVDDRVVRSEVTLRVRANELDAALAEIRGAGEVLAESVTGQDVSAEFVDVQARLKSKRVLEERLLAIASEAREVEPMLKVETELERVRAQIEQLEGQSHLLLDRSRLSLIHVTAESPAQPVVAQAESFGSKLSAAWTRALRLAGDVVAGLIVMAGVLVPLLAGFACVAVPLALVLRRRRRIAFARLVAATGEPGSL